MKFIFTFFILIATFVNSQSQSLTGIWRGSFEQSSLDDNTRFTSEKYKYEVQINNLDNGAVEGVTYSYLTTVFYGKASLKGILNKKTKTLTLKETIMIDMKATGKTLPCLMTCYLDYSKIGKLETLTGTYSSINSKNMGDCGSGTVYLEKVVESDFEKEPFLINKKTAPKNATAPKENIIKKGSLAITPQKNSNNLKPNNAKKAIVIPNNNTKNTTANSNKINLNKSNTKSNNLHSSNNKIQQLSNAHNATPKNKTIKPGATDFVIKKHTNKKEDTAVLSKTETPQNTIQTTGSTTKIIEEPTAEVLKQRENILVNKLVVNNPIVTLEFYDNGEIDNDTISVYKDNKLVVNNQRLSITPIVLNLKFDEVNTFYELITVAENLGDIPPNTALMVVTYGRTRKEVFLTSDDKSNAKVIIEYKK